MKNDYDHGSLAPFLDIAGLSFPVDWQEIFGNSHSLEAEIGFGTGEYITAVAAQDTECNFVGFEEDAKRTIKTLKKIHKAGLTNVRLLKLDAVQGLEHLFQACSLRKVHCLFPCPWPKKRHTKHRLFQGKVLRLIHSRLKPGGELLIVTDHKPYADWIAENFLPEDFRSERRTVQPRFDTKFERKWREAGQEEFYELVLTRTGGQPVDHKGVESVKVYFLKELVPERMAFEDQSGPASPAKRGERGELFMIQFSDFLFDAMRKKAMVHAIITEDRRSQHAWIMIKHTSKGWCVSLAEGSAVLPTEGVQKAVELVYEAALRSVA
jgi:tRNA (guanine-N7-)-methyltransferase